MIQRRYLPAECYNPTRLLERREGSALHYVSGKWAFPHDRFNPELVWNLVRDLNYPGGQRVYGLVSVLETKSWSSYHWLIPRTGETWELVHPHYQAYHAGVSKFRGESHCNRFMFGVALIGDADTDFTAEQYFACAKLHRSLVGQFGIDVEAIVGHEDIAPGRKHDPGPRWSWPLFRALMAQPSAHGFYRWKV